jgi:hypothetical protein
MCGAAESSVSKLEKSIVEIKIDPGDVVTSSVVRIQC